jgi:hypothetical protein
MADNDNSNVNVNTTDDVANAPPEEAPVANSGEEMEIDPSPADLKIFEPDFGTLKAEPPMSSIVVPSTSMGEDDDVAGKNVIVKRKSLKFRKAFSQVWQIRIVNANARTKTFATTHAFFDEIS